MIHRYILHNNQILDSTEKVLLPGQLGVLSGWGIFSTIRVASGVLFAYDWHWARMQRDAKLMHVPFPTDPAAFEQSLLKLVEANGKQDCTLRVCVIRNKGGLWQGPGIDRDFDIIALTADINAWGSSVRLGVVHQASPRRKPLCRHQGPFLGPQPHHV